MTVSAIITEWGALYRAGLATIADLMVMLRQKSETEALFPVRYTDSTILERASAEFTRVLQRFQKAFTPVSGVTFEPRKIPLYRLKIDASEYPDDLAESWLGFLADNNLDRKTWPFTKWWLKNLIEQAAADMEKSEIFLGVQGSITPGTATAAGTSINGIRKQIRDGVTAGDMNNLALGAVPTDPLELVEYLEAFFYGMPEIMRPEIDCIVLNNDIRRRFREGMRLKYNQHYRAVEDVLAIEGTNCKIVGVASHATSNMIWATPKWNRQMGFKGSGNETIFQVESEDRKVKAFTDYYKGYGYWIHEYVYTNGQDLS